MGVGYLMKKPNVGIEGLAKPVHSNDWLGFYIFGKPTRIER